MEYIFYEVVFLNNFNFDKQTMDKLNSMLNNGNLNDMLSQIPPDTLKNLSSMINNNSSSQTDQHTHSDNSNNSNSEHTHPSNFNAEHTHSSNNPNANTNLNNFDFSNIDINTMMKVKSVMEKMNHSSNPSANLLQSLKPYLRDEKKSKLDQYANLLNMANLMELFNQNNSKENSSD